MKKVFMALFLEGCCAPCVQQPPTVVPVARTCELPPLALPEAAPAASGCPPAFVCFDLENAKRLALRSDMMRTWIREVRAACQPVASRPATATQPAASRSARGE